MICPRCSASNDPDGEFCGSCGQRLPAPADVAATTAPLPPVAAGTARLRPTPAAPPVAPAQVYGYPEAAPVPVPPVYRGYWRALLVTGFLGTLLGVVLILGAVDTAVHNAQASQEGTTAANRAAVAPEFWAGVLISVVAPVLLIPGIIGWGIHASGLTRRPRPS